MAVLKTMRAVAVTLGLGMCLLGLGRAGKAAAADWPNWRGPNHDGVSNETGWSTNWPADGPKVLWRASLGTGFATMAVSNGRVYAIGNINDNDILYCFDADTGKEIWKKSYPCPLFDKDHEGGPSAAPTVEAGVVYTFSKNGDVVCFRADTGDVLWHRNIVKEQGIKHPTWYFASSPRVIDNLIILNAGTNGIALNKADGKVAWENGKAPASYATAVAFDAGAQKCAAIMTANEMVVVAASTGKIILRHPWKSSYDINASDPIISGDTMFVCSGYNKGCALLKIQQDGVTEIWRNKNMSNHANSCVLWEGYIYGFNGQVGGGGKLTCLDHKTGQVKWSQAGLGTGSLMVADGKLIVLGESGKLVIAKASPEKFEELASAQILKGKCWTVPVLANGRIYARNAKGDLVCLDVRR